MHKITTSALQHARALLLDLTAMGVASRNDLGERTAMMVYSVMPELCCRESVARHLLVIMNTMSKAHPLNDVVAVRRQ